MSIEYVWIFSLSPQKPCKHTQFVRRFDAAEQHSKHGVFNHALIPNQFDLYNDNHYNPQQNRKITKTSETNSYKLTPPEG